MIEKMRGDKSNAAAMFFMVSSNMIDVTSEQCDVVHDYFIGNRPSYRDLIKGAIDALYFLMWDDQPNNEFECGYNFANFNVHLYHTRNFFHIKYNNTLVARIKMDGEFIKFTIPKALDPNIFEHSDPGVHHSLLMVHDRNLDRNPSEDYYNAWMTLLDIVTLMVEAKSMQDELDYLERTYYYA